MRKGEFAPALESVSSGHCGRTEQAFAIRGAEVGHRYPDLVSHKIHSSKMPDRTAGAAAKSSGTNRFRAALVSMLAGLLLSGGVTPAASADEWCDSDPVVMIKTPSGSLVPVYVNTGARGAEHLPAALAAQMDYAAASVANGSATKVKLTVMVPPDAFSSSFDTRSVVSTGAFGTGTRYAATTGYSGQGMKMEFALPVP
jgi:hypothetical protein